MLAHNCSYQGANFRDLKGVYVKDNKVYLDPDVERPTVKSGKPLVNLSWLFRFNLFFSALSFKPMIFIFIMGYTGP